MFLIVGRNVFEKKLSDSCYEMFSKDGEQEQNELRDKLLQLNNRIMRVAALGCTD